MKGAGKYHGLSENADWSLFVPEPPAPHALPGTGRHINKCLLNWISPIAVQQNRLSHGEQQANGLITCCFRTKWIKSWAQHEPASDHRNQFFLPANICLQQNTEIEKNWLLTFILCLYWWVYNCSSQRTASLIQWVTKRVTSPWLEIRQTQRLVTHL